MEGSGDAKITIVAQDPSILVDNRVLSARVDLPLETCSSGPEGVRVRIIDYDATTDNRMRALLSTVTPNTWSADKYVQIHTEIPRQTLLDELAGQTELDSTDDWDRSELVTIYEIPGD